MLVASAAVPNLSDPALAFSARVDVSSAAAAISLIVSLRVSTAAVASVTAPDISSVTDEIFSAAACLLAAVLFCALLSDFWRDTFL